MAGGRQSTCAGVRCRRRVKPREHGARQTGTRWRRRRRREREVEPAYTGRGNVNGGRPARRPRSRCRSGRRRSHFVARHGSTKGGGWRVGTCSGRRMAAMAEGTDNGVGRAGREWDGWRWRGVWRGRRRWLAAGKPSRVVTGRRAGRNSSGPDIYQLQNC